MTLYDYVSLFARGIRKCCIETVITISVDTLAYEHGCGHLSLVCEKHGMNQVYHFGLGTSYHCERKAIK
jgi:hypothetical protein